VISKDQVIDSVRKQDRTILTEIESKKLLEGAGINTVETRLASSQREAIDLSEQIGFPIVLKIASPRYISQKRCWRSKSRAEE